ncbi:multidrug effflux MFS transporter [Sphingomonas sp.]|jgi:DHA1 family bicyclomycin/chloramphenicol resistance-like MFS transporter|uniref:multidrug effflux MFS transporter n=1 Tax=Sphingomonas sp. TaxID=28214 RepID=UPI002E34A8BD|nr:multidrug effflux MFS transporter [Sphingomonas sp.]HEX4694950.1 multidrug effflux MFS transporter [Sphingomonas sp.]
MQQAELSPRDAPSSPIRFVEFVALIAALMAVGALGIDTMLPALPDVGRDLGATARDLPLVIVMFSTGFGVAQLAHGPLADRFGRRPVLIGALAWYVVMNLACAAASSLDMLLTARVCAGLGIAATRVVTIALIRDCYSGRAMARVTSLAVMTFMVFPIIAPSIGQAILAFGSWRLIFNMIAVVSTLIAGWFILRMPETLAAENRVPLEWRRLVANWRFTLADRQSVGYAAAVIGLQGALFGYITSIQPIVADVFHQPHRLGLVFALCAGTMMVGNLLNSRIVMWLGMRRISHGAMLVLIVAASSSLLIEHLGLESLWTFVVLQAVTMMCFGLAASNCSAMAMANMGAIAGTASSLQGFVITTGGALIGGVIGTSFDGTTTPLHSGFLAAGLVALTLAAIVERGRLFRPT